jgi:hypothetical protein
MLAASLSAFGLKGGIGGPRVSYAVFTESAPGDGISIAPIDVLRRIGATQKQKIRHFIFCK